MPTFKTDTERCEIPAPTLNTRHGLREKVLDDLCDMSKKTFIPIYDPPPPGFMGRGKCIRGSVKIPQLFYAFYPYITGV